jgi:hypothetical protein
MWKQTDTVKLQFVVNDGTDSAKPSYEGTAESSNLSAIMRNNVIMVGAAIISYGDFPVEAPELPKTNIK